MYDIRKLDVYNMALDFSNEIWEICSKWDWFPKKTIGSQLVQSADSISANISEGFGRYSYKENLKFCYYARGSLEETKDWIRKAYNRNLIKEKEKQKIESFLKEFPIKFNPPTGRSKKLKNILIMSKLVNW